MMICHSGDERMSGSVPAVRWATLRAVLAASLIAFGFVFAVAHFSEPFVDFRAFYCAGEASLAGADPYREHPLHECEANVAAFGFAALGNHATIPAPFPGFVLALFAVLARLPFAWALAGWEVASALALGAAMVLTARTTGFSLTAAAIALGLAGAVLALPIGQITPFVLLAVVSTAALLKAGRPRAAALAALGALLDPHVGLALVLALFVGSRPTRGPLIVAAVVLAAIGLAANGPQHEWEYLHLVVPAHARANVADATQFSATTAAFEAGATPAVALLLGSIWYALALAAGIAVALRLRARLGAAALALVPPAFAVFGGTYTHTQQLSIAIPAFMLLGAALEGRSRDWCSALTFLASVPWIFITPYPALFIVPVALAAVYARETRSARQTVRLAAASFLVLTTTLLALLAPHAARRIASPSVLGNPLADASWQLFMEAWNVPLQPWYLVARIPTALAFFALLGAFAVIAARGRKPATARHGRRANIEPRIA